MINMKILISIVLISAVVLGTVYIYNQNSVASRQAEVREKGAEVMPFDLDKTTHIFQKTDNGGVQQVIAKDAKDGKNISLIREHLKEEADNFQRGDYSDPAFIHGMNMAGLSDLSNAYKKITITFKELPNGAQITYLTDDPELVNAIHHWFTAQTMDHGADAMDHM
jgi:hypothetical protein